MKLNFRAGAKSNATTQNSTRQISASRLMASFPSAGTPGEGRVRVLRGGCSLGDRSSLARTLTPVRSRRSGRGRNTRGRLRRRDERAIGSIKRKAIPDALRQVGKSPRRRQIVGAAGG